jgi:hypothetical protein
VGRGGVIRNEFGADSGSAGPYIRRVYAVDPYDKYFEIAPAVFPPGTPWELSDQEDD